MDRRFSVSWRSVLPILNGMQLSSAEYNDCTRVRLFRMHASIRYLHAVEWSSLQRIPNVIR